MRIFSLPHPIPLCDHSALLLGLSFVGENEAGEVEWPQGVKGENGEGVILVGGQQQEEP